MPDLDSRSRCRIWVPDWDAGEDRDPIIESEEFEEALASSRYAGGWGRSPLPKGPRRPKADWRANSANGTLCQWGHRDPVPMRPTGPIAHLEGDVSVSCILIYKQDGHCLNSHMLHLGSQHCKLGWRTEGGRQEGRLVTLQQRRNQEGRRE